MSDNRLYAEVSLTAIRDNLRAIHRTLDKKSRIIAVIKADGYGHGAVPTAEILEKEEHIFGYAVATAEEAFELRDAGIKKPILILGYTWPEDYERLISEDIRPAVFKKETAVLLSETAKKLGRAARIHIKVDTGMSRIGVPCTKEGLSLVKEINELPDIIMEGIFTHFSKADEYDKSFAHTQLERFDSFTAACAENGIEFEYRHCANSAAILELKETDTGLVRAGIIIYGLRPSDEVDIKRFGLVPALSLKSSVIYIKRVPKDTPVSYGGTFVTERETVIATIPAGYADGYPRSLSNKGYVLIRGKRAKVLGRVCMDQMMVDVTDIPGAEEHDEVVLLGRQGDEEITAEELGRLSGRFNYELVCEISPRVPRHYS